MARFVLFLLLLIPLAHAGLWLGAHPGQFRFDWLGYHVEISMALSALLLALLAVLLLTLGMMGWGLMGWPERRRLRRRIAHDDLGLQHLTQALIAAASNDYEPARKALLKAGALLPQSPLPHLIGAQLSTRSAQMEHARAHLAALTHYAPTAQLALQQSLRDAIRGRNLAEMDQLLTEAERRYPRARWVLEAQLRVALARDAMGPLIRALSGLQMRPLLGRAERNRLLSRLYFLQVNDRTALHYDAAFLPAACRLSATLANQGHTQKAVQVLKAAWRLKPATPIADSLLSAIDGLAEKVQTRYVRKFAALAYPHAESEDVLARISQRHGRLDDALQHAKRAMELAATKERVSRIAEIVALRDGADAANGWLKEALRIAYHEGWFCSSCGTEHHAWAMQCTHCEALDTLSWQRSSAPASEIITKA